MMFSIPIWLDSKSDCAKVRKVKRIRPAKLHGPQSNSSLSPPSDLPSILVFAFCTTSGFRRYCGLSTPGRPASQPDSHSSTRWICPSLLGLRAADDQPARVGDTFPLVQHNVWFT